MFYNSILALQHNESTPIRGFFESAKIGIIWVGGVGIEK